MKKRTGKPKEGSRPPGAPSKRRARSAAVGVSGAETFQALRRTASGFSFQGPSFRVNFDFSELERRIGFLLDVLCDDESGFGLRFADIAESKQLNTTYRGKAKPTDVLSFSAFEDNRRLLRLGLPEAETRRFGDLCVCVPVCLVQAQERRVSLSSELERMIVHGMCHLRGFDHERSLESERVMVKLESALRAELVKEYGRPHWASDMEWI